jgi:hypothetical protein
MVVSKFYTAEDMIQNEIDVYNRLGFAWGSVVPQFYGAHSVSQSWRSDIYLSSY